MKFGGSKPTEVHQERRARPWRAPGGGLDAIIKSPSPPPHVSTALKDGEISDQEYRLVLDEWAKYSGMRDEIRAGARKTHATVALDTATKNELLQRGRTEARLSFMRKLQDGP